MLTSEDAILVRFLLEKKSKVEKQIEAINIILQSLGESHLDTLNELRESYPLCETAPKVNHDIAQ